MYEDIIENIRSRVEQCKRLAAMITDKPAIDILLKMAREGDADIKRLEARKRAATTDKGPASPNI